MITSRSFPGSALSSRSHKTDDQNATTQKASWKRWTSNETTPFPVLIPVFDLANHEPSAKVLWDFTGDCCIFSTDTRVEAGSQVWNNYGPKGNEECESTLNNSALYVIFAYLNQWSTVGIWI